MKSLVVAVALLGASTALSQPANDNFADAIIIEDLPFTDATDTNDATRESIDYTCVGSGPTVWYAYPVPVVNVPTLMEANTFGSDYDTTLTVAVGSPGAFTLVACNDDALGLQSRVRFTAVPGQLYYIVAGGYSSYSRGNLRFKFDVAPSSPSPLELGVSIKSATVVPTNGSGTVNGEVTCNNDSIVLVSGQITQKFGGTRAIAYFGSYLFCRGGVTTPWSFSYISDPGRGGGRSTALLRGGPATISVSADGFDADESEDEALVSGIFPLRVTR